jgi:hypothetical protein
MQSLLISNTAGASNMNNFAIGLASTTEFTALNFSNLFSGGEITDVKCVRYSSATSGFSVIANVDTVGLNFTRLNVQMFGSTTAITRGNATVYCMANTRCNDAVYTDCKFICGRLDFITCSNIDVINPQYADAISGTTATTNAIAFININTSSNDIYVQGFSNYEGIVNVHPYNGLFAVLNSFNIEVRSIGTATTPYNCGTVNAMGLIMTATVSLDIRLRRVYCTNLRTGCLSLANTDQNIICENVWGDAGDAQAIAGLNITPKGCK